MENPKMMDKRVSLKSAIVLMLIAVLISTTIVYVLAVSPSSTFTVSPGVYPGAPSFTVWREGSNYFAKDANGFIAYSGTDATTLIQSVFNQYPQKVLFKAGTYDLDGNTVTAYVPIIIEGEGKKSEIYEGSLVVKGTDCLYGTWLENCNAVRDMRFNATVGINQLRFVNVTNGQIYGNAFWTSLYQLACPQLRLSDCLSIKVYNNWFDGQNCQILRADGAYAVFPLHHIYNNDFGSTITGTFPTSSHPWEVAAVYIEGGNNVGITIESNLIFLNPKNIAVYTEAEQTIINYNQIVCSEDNYFAIWCDSIVGKHTIVGNYITIYSGSQGAIAIYKTGSTNPLYYNTITDNHISSAVATSAVYGIFCESVISRNIIYGKNGIKMYNSSYNIIDNNLFSRIGSSSDFAFQETGPSNNNVLIGDVARLGYIYTVGGNTKVNLCWNNTIWIP